MEENVKYNVDTTQGVDSLTALKNELKAAKAEMLGAEEGSAQYTAALNKAAAANFKLKEANEQIQASAADVGVVISNTSAVLGGMVGAINGVKAVSALLGTDNEMLEKTFVQLQEGMSIVQGFNGIDGMIKGFKNLGTIIKSSTIITKIWDTVMKMSSVFLIVTGVVALTGAIIGLVSWMRTSNEEQERANKLAQEAIELNNRQEKYLEARKIAQDEELKILRIKGATEKEILEAKQKQLEADEALIKKDIEKFENQKKIYEAEGEEFPEERQKTLDKLLELEKKNATELLKVQSDLRVEQARLDNVKPVNDKKASELKLQNIEDDKERELAILKSKYDEEVQAAKGHKELLKQLEIKYYNDKAKIERESNVKINSQGFDIFSKYVDDKVTKTKSFEDIVKQSMQTLSEGDKAYVQESLQEWLWLNENKIQAFNESSNVLLSGSSQLLGAINNLNNIQTQNEINAAEGNEAKIESIRKKQFEANKKFQIATTIMSGLQGVINALGAVTTIPEPFGMILKSTNAAFIAATSAINVKAIRATQYSGGSSSPSVGGGGSRISAPQITDRLTPVRNVNTPTEIDLQRQPVKAYILESDLQKSRLNTENKTKETEF